MKSIVRGAVQGGFPGMVALGKILSRRLYERPIFVVGVGRSGTSILLKSLGEHRQILNATRETPLISNVAQVCYQFTSGPEAEHLSYCCRIPLPEMLKIHRRLLFEICWGANFGAWVFLREWITSPLAMKQKRSWLGRIFPDEEAAKGLLTLFPKVKFIYIHRNGIEVVASRMKFKAFKNDSFESHCRFWANSADKYSDLEKLDSAIMIRHRDLVYERGDTYKSIIKFLDLDYDDGPTLYAESNMVIPHDIPREQERLTNIDVTNRFESRPASYLEWNSEQKKIFKQICSSAMKQLGYEIPF